MPIKTGNAMKLCTPFLPDFEGHQSNPIIFFSCCVQPETGICDRVAPSVESVDLPMMNGIFNATQHEAIELIAILFFTWDVQQQTLLFMVPFTYRRQALEM